MRSRRETGSRAARSACCAIVVWVVLGSTACIVEDEDRCSPHQVLDEGLCRCAEGATLVGNACTVSVLDAGLDAGAPAPEGGLGAGCGPATACSDPAYPSCQQSPAGDQYCSSTGCSTASDCPMGYQCVMTSTPSYCRRPYTGQNTPCRTSADCTGDARFCSARLSGCLVRDCTETSCDPGYVCFRAGDFMPGTPNVCVMSELLNP